MNISTLEDALMEIERLIEKSAQKDYHITRLKEELLTAKKEVWFKDGQINELRISIKDLSISLKEMAREWRT